MRLKKCLSASIVLFLIIITMSPCLAKENDTEIKTSGSYGKGYRYNIQGWVYIHIEGEPYERGYQYGYLAADEIVDMMERWSNWGHTQKILKRLPIDIDSPRYDDISELWWEYCKSKAKRIFLKHYPTEYIEEMEGIADGVRDRGGMIHGHQVEFDDILTTNEIVDCWFSYEFLNKRSSPLRGIIQGIKNIFSKEKIGSCSAFIATGDATSTGEIIIAHSTHVPKLYLPERFNIILDVKPSKGNRFIMACPPGTITSMTDYYQNEKGILLTETTYYPQGPWKINAVPIPVRSRQAIQYSDSIDDVLKYLKEGNNGLYGCEWLIGNTKTGEIASIELALYNTPVKRTNNGFYWSCNEPHDKKVSREIYGISTFFYQIAAKIFPSIVNQRAEKFKEIEKEYYGRIDIESAKTILETFPICCPSSDGKITSSRLMKDLGFLAYMGNPNGTTWATTSQWEKKFKGITELPSVGWVEIYPLLSIPDSVLRHEKQDGALKESRVLWQSKLDTEIYQYTSSITISDGVIFTGDSSGNIKAIALNDEDELWNEKVKGEIIKSSVSKEIVYVGSDEGLYAFDKKTGEIKWSQSISRIYSKPVFNDDLVIVSSSDGGVYAFNADSGGKTWEYKFSHPAHISGIKDNSIYVGSDDTCYRLDIDDKKILWMRKTEGPITAPPKINGNMVLLGSWDGNIYSLDSQNGDVLWEYKTGWGIDSTPIVSNGRVYIGGLDNNFYALDENSGDLIWFYTCKSAIHSSPIIYGEYVFFGCDDGRFYALTQEDGALAWSFTPDYYLKNDANSYLTTAINSNPIVDDGVIYIEVDGNVYALEPQTDELIKEEIVLESSTNHYNLIIILGFSILILFVLCFLYIHKRQNDS